MGAVHFSIDTDLVEALQGALPLRTFVETGTFKGDALEAVAPRFERLLSVEISEPLWREAAARFAGRPEIEVHHGHSPEVLARVVPGLGRDGILYWLDAHWCVADNTGGERSQCPLIEEIAAIGTLGPSSVVLVDDARLFLATPPAPHDATHWPSFAEVVAALRRTSRTHELMVVNDVIAFYPLRARPALQAYARRHGIDWLHAAQALRGVPEAQAAVRDLHAALEEKEAVIQSQAAGLQRLAALDAELHAKEGVIQAQAAELQELPALRAALEAKDALLHSRALELQQRDAALRELEASRSQQQLWAQAAQELHRALNQLQSQQERLAQALQEKVSVIETLQGAVAQGDEASREAREAVQSAEFNQAMLRSLREKEAVIQELSRALNAYRSAFLGVQSLMRPVHATANGVRSAGVRLGRLLLPRLGILNQHEPIEMRLPASYAQPVALARTPTISLVTPSFRQARFIERTLRSVLDQGYPALEYFVQDGGSDDGTRTILERYGARLAGWESAPDSGQTQAINRGFARTPNGEIMAWLNSDDLLLPGALAYVADYFNRHPEVDVVYGHRILIDEDDREIGRWVMPPHDDRVLSWADYVPQETLFWRRAIWEKAGGQVDESFRFAMDWDLLVRFRAAGARFARLPRFLGGFRIHAHQKTSAVITDVGFREMDRIRERVLGRVPSRDEVRNAVAPYLLRHVASDLWWRACNRLTAKQPAPSFA